MKISVDLVLLGSHTRKLYAALDPHSRKPSLPSGSPGKNESLDAAAMRIARTATNAAPQWIEQLGAFTDPSQANAAISVGYVGVLPFERTHVWKAVDLLSALPDRQRRELTAGVVALQQRLDHAPIAFSMLPRAFTLSELQETYETLLGRRLHKASFRRALQASHLVAPTGDERSEGRGRPAQLYRYVPRRRKQKHRVVRFDLL